MVHGPRSYKLHRERGKSTTDAGGAQIGGVRGGLRHENNPRGLRICGARCLPPHRHARSLLGCGHPHAGFVLALLDLPLGHQLACVVCALLSADEAPGAVQRAILLTDGQRFIVGCQRQGARYDIRFSGVRGLDPVIHLCTDNDPQDW
jgi:hypothetical protein